jgi:uncharacterized 2Fe-2S/4Fe-4S cluster protein (DUF4445 family)
MNVYVTFEPSGNCGLVASGTYLWDAAKRLGVKVPGKCNSLAECHECVFTIKEGMGSLSSVTNVERQSLSEEQLKANERLACQARIIGEDDVVVFIPQDAHPEIDTVEKFEREFGKLAIDKKYAVLYELEQAALRQGFSADLGLIGNKEIAEAFHKDYETMTQAQKLALLTKLESAATVHTAFSVLNLPWTIGEKILDLMAVQGHKIHKAERKNSKGVGE